MAVMKTWLHRLVAVSILCAIADTLMPSGGPKRVGRLVCGLVLACTVCQPLLELDLNEGQQWLESWQSELNGCEAGLTDQADAARKSIIEEEYRAYILDKAARMGAGSPDVRVESAPDGDGLFLPSRVVISGPMDAAEWEVLADAVEADLGIRPERGEEGTS